MFQKAFQNREMKSESGFREAMACQPFHKNFIYENVA
jgi:hypothetical protein